MAGQPPLRPQFQPPVQSHVRGYPLHGTDQWYNHFLDWPDVGPQLEVHTPEGSPLTPPELEFCRTHGFEFKNFLGSGGFGEVWSCTASQLGGGPRHLACKILSIRKYHRMGANYSLREAVNKMLYEVDITHDLESHPNILKGEAVFNVPEPKTGFPFVRCLIFTELCEGDVYDDLERRPSRTYPQNEALAVILDVGRGLKHLHNNNICHFDLKPKNIVYLTDPTTGRRVHKLADFGLSKRWPPGVQCMVTTALCTERYRAPELEEQTESDGKKADIYSLGITLLELLVGRWRMIMCLNDIRAQIALPQLVTKYGVSLPLLDLIKKMVDFEWIKRPTIGNILGE